MVSVKEAKNKLLENGIGVMFLDSFCNRGTKDTWRDQSKATMVSQAIDTMSAYKFLKSHPRSNGKLGTTGHSRGGTNSPCSLQNVFKTLKPSLKSNPANICSARLTSYS